MKDAPIPILAYGLIGVTTLVLSYATFLDSQGAKGGPAAPGQSSTSMLPNISAMNPFSQSAPAAAASNSSILSSISQVPSQAVPSAPQLPTATKIGGRKNTKRKLAKQKHNKTKGGK
jgi:hypothetical protein